MENISTKNTPSYTVTDADKQRAFSELLRKHLGAKIQIAGDATLREAKKSGLYAVLRQEIADFLDFFHAQHMWKRLYVSSTLNHLQEELITRSAAEHRVKVMQIASEMHDLIKKTFQEDEEGYRKATDGLGRIVEVFLTWASGLKVSDTPKYRGAKTDGNPIAFLKKHYALLIADGRLSQISLREQDEKLLNALKYELQKNERSLSELVPSGIRR